MNTVNKSQQNIINHFALVLDASTSMSDHAANVIKVADTQIQHLAEQSKIMDQETRVSVYTFSYASDIQCLIYDKDVLRMPSIANLYRAHGMTALASATTLAINDLKLTPEKYGEHSFLLYIVTDGMENDSRQTDVTNLPDLINGLPDHWTLAGFVPDAQGIFYMKKLGFPAGNLTIWNTSADNGFLEVGEIIRNSTDNYMHARAQGVRGSKSLFTTTATTTKDIKKTLTPVTKGSYTIEKVKLDTRIDEFVAGYLGSYIPGRGYYELTKRVTIQGYKQIAILADGKLYMGDAARTLIGLPKDTDVRVSPGDHPGYKVFVQSTAMNRKLLAGTECLIMR